MLVRRDMDVSPFALGTSGKTSSRSLKTPVELDAIADVVLAYKPKPKTKAAKRRKRRAQNAKRKRR